MQITIPASAEAMLKRQAEQSGFASIEEYVLSVVLPQHRVNGVASSRSFFDAASELGLIGGGSEYAPDLSTNPEHLKGFGR